MSDKNLTTFLTEWGGQVKELIEPKDESKEEFVVTSMNHYETSLSEEYLVQATIMNYDGGTVFLANLDVLSGAYPPYELEYVDGNNNKFYIISDTPSVISLYIKNGGRSASSSYYIKNKYNVRSQLLRFVFYDGDYL